MKKLIVVGFLVSLALILSFTQAYAKTTLKFYYWDENQKPGMDLIISDFEKMNPDIQVKTTIIPNRQYWTKIMTALPTSAGPDIFWLNGVNAGTYMASGLVLNLQPFIDKEGLDLSPFPQSLRDIYSYDGKTYGIPKDYDTIALVYYKPAFDEVGIPYPNADWTWDDLLEAAKKLTVRGADGKVSRWGFIATPWVQDCVANLIYQNGGKIYNDDKTKAIVNNPETIEAIQFLVDMMYVHKVSPNGAEQKDFDQAAQFSSGNLAMAFDGSWMMTQYYQTLGDKFGVAPLPMKKQRATVIHGLGFVASAKTKNQEAAWKFLKFTASKQAGEYQANVVIPAYAGAEKQWLANFPGLDLQAFIDEVEYSYPLPISVKNGRPSWIAFHNGLSEIWLQTTNVPDGVANMEKVMNEEINKE